MFPEVLETPLQFTFVTSLSNKRYSYHLWLLVITKSGKKESNKFSKFQIKVFFPPKVSPPPPNIGPSNLSFLRIYAQGVLTGFY